MVCGVGKVICVVMVEEYVVVEFVYVFFFGMGEWNVDGCVV